MSSPGSQDLDLSIFDNADKKIKYTYTPHHVDTEYKNMVHHDVLDPNDTEYKNMINDNVIDPNNPDPHFAALARKVKPISHSEMKGVRDNTPYEDRYWGDGKPLPGFGTYNLKNYPILGLNQKRLGSNKKRRGNGGKKQKTNKKIKSKKNKKRSKRTRKNRKSKK
jgi:hypothetical protein